MAKIQARNIDEALFQRIEASAMKHERSLEGEIRIALRGYYTPVEAETLPLSLRERWQRKTGSRLRWIIGEMAADAKPEQQHARVPEVSEFIRFGQEIGISPGKLMDMSEGLVELPTALAMDLERSIGVSAEWLLAGKGKPFPILDLMDHYRPFLLPENDEGQHTYEFVRIADGRAPGELLIIRRQVQTGAVSMATATGRFYLAGGMGSGGFGHLKSFLVFLKTECQHLSINTYDLHLGDEESLFWDEAGQHHPQWYRHDKRRTQADWLQKIYMGIDPGNWFEGWRMILAEIKAVPFGGETKSG